MNNITNWKWIVFGFTILISFISVTLSTPIEDDDNPYRHVRILDPNGKYRLEWLVDSEQERIYFNVTVKTLGWVGFGIAKQAKMNGADLVIGGISSKTGKAYFTDRYAIGNQIPIEDKKQDWILHSASESATHTHLSFSRKFDTCDKHDIAITEDSRQLLWAYGEKDTLDYHYGNRGNVPMHLRDPDLTPRIIQERIRNGLVQGPIETPDAKIWRLQRSFQIPPKPTTYWCRIHKLNSNGIKHHMIGYSATVNNETRNNVHHMLLFRCTDPNAEQIYEKYLNHPGEECYTQAIQLGEIPFRSCTELKMGWAIGSTATFFPEEMGIPFGHSGNRNEYYLLQIHYDNPNKREDLVSVSEIDLYLTPKLRPNDGALISVGHNIPGNPSILVPPYSLDHEVFGHCAPSCTQKLLPNKGIRLVGALIHSHNAGIKLTLHHFRNNHELPHILNDNNYIPTYQPVRLLHEERVVLPGDQITMHCHYRNTHTNGTTIGGWGAEKEMCKSFVYYYGALEGYMCRSEIRSPAYVAKYFAGTRNITWNQAKQEMVATSPAHLAGMALSEISDSRYVHWSTDLRAELQKDHLLLPQVTVCPTDRELQAGLRGDIDPTLIPPQFVTYPVHVKPYQPPKKCTLV